MDNSEFERITNYIENDEGLYFTVQEYLKNLKKNCNLDRIPCYVVDEFRDFILEILLESIDSRNWLVIDIVRDYVRSQWCELKEYLESSLEEIKDDENDENE